MRRVQGHRKRITIFIFTFSFQIHAFCIIVLTFYLQQRRKKEIILFDSCSRRNVNHGPLWRKAEHNGISTFSFTRKSFWTVTKSNM